MHGASEASEISFRSAMIISCSMVCLVRVEKELEGVLLAPRDTACTDNRLESVCGASSWNLWVNTFIVASLEDRNLFKSVLDPC